MRHRVSPLVAALFLAMIAWRLAGAQSSDILAGSVDGGFEAGGAGWTVSGAVAAFDGNAPVQEGAQAAHLEASGEIVVVLLSKYWLVPTEPGAEHTLRVWVYDDDAAITDVEARLEFLDGGGGSLPAGAASAVLGVESAYQELVVGPVIAPEGAVYAQVRVIATADAASSVPPTDRPLTYRSRSPRPATASRWNATPSTPSRADTGSSAAATG